VVGLTHITQPAPLYPLRSTGPANQTTTIILRSAFISLDVCLLLSCMCATVLSRESHHASINYPAKHTYLQYIRSFFICFFSKSQSQGVRAPLNMELRLPPPSRGPTQRRRQRQSTQRSRFPEHDVSPN
jgi:hypothetical protein